MSQVKGKNVKKSVSNSSELKNSSVNKVRKRKVNLEKKTVSSSDELKKESVSKVRKRKVNLDNKSLKVDSLSSDYKKSKKRSKKIRGSKIRYHRLYEKDYDNNKENNEINLNESVASEDNLSIGIIIFILVVCFILGISLGYFLYRLAISSSALIVIPSILY